MSVSANSSFNEQINEQLNNFRERYLAGDSKIDDGRAPSLVDTINNPDETGNIIGDQSAYKDLIAFNDNLPVDYQEIVANRNLFGLIVLNNEGDQDKENQDIENQSDNQDRDESQIENDETDIVLEVDNSLEDNNLIDEQQSAQQEEEESNQEIDSELDDRLNYMDQVESVPFYLQGVSLKENDRMAIIISQNNHQSYLIRVGQTIDGYLVKSIDENSVIMEKSDQEFVVHFKGENVFR
ncbi:MAG: hypothetical protein ACLFPF_07870 [Halanaerobiales bacterium]